MKLLNFLFNPTKKLRKRVEEISALEAEIRQLSNEGLKAESNKLKQYFSNLTSSQDVRLELDSVLPRAFALVREAAKRTLGQRHFDVQLMGGIILHEGKIAEMATGEGKTLASTAPVYLNALAGKGVHVVTVNEYLAKRDVVWMGQVYNLLGLSVACLVHEGAFLYDPNIRTSGVQNIDNNNRIPDVPKLKESALLDRERDVTGSFLVQSEFLRPISRKDAYLADITYGTNHEFGFDYLRDNLVYSLDQQVQTRRFTQNAAQKNAEDFQCSSAFSPRSSATESKPFNFAIVDEVDSVLIDEARTPLIISAPDTESSDFYKIFSRLASVLIKDEDYLLDEKYHSVSITEPGIDKVEKALKIKNIYAPENLRLTHYLEESLKAHALFKRDKDYVVKNNEIIIVDQNTGRLMLGRRYSGGLHQAIEAKEGVRVQQESRTYAQITIQNYFRLYKKLAGMTGTAQTSAEEFDKVYGLSVVSIPTNKLMVRQDLPDVIYKTAEAKFQAVAEEVKKRQEKGQPVLLGTISIEKNELLSQYLNRKGVRHEILNAKNNEREGAIIAQAGRAGAVTVATNMAGRGVDIILGGNPPDILEGERVKGLGGLHVIGTERHDARRIDNQLRGRSGRQGDAGSSQFFLSLEDDLMRIFGGDRIKNLMETLDVPENMPIESNLVSKAVSQAQSQVEGFNFDARKHLLEYDDILNKQRMAIYEKRQKMLEENAPPQILSMLDLLWMNHLENMEALRESVRLRAYGQHEPLTEYRREGSLMFKQLMADFESWLHNFSQAQNNAEITQKYAVMAQKPADNTQKNAEKFLRGSAFSQRSSASNFSDRKIGRNDPCPCGAKDSNGHSIKYKRCHGR